VEVGFPIPQLSVAEILVAKNSSCCGEELLTFKGTSLDVRCETLADKRSRDERLASCEKVETCRFVSDDDVMFAAKACDVS
jgi:hypothetical protein